MPIHTSKAFHANGKLLISGEYLVLRGANALALPVRKGQLLHTVPSGVFQRLIWTTIVGTKTWFEAEFKPDTLDISSTSNEKSAKFIQNLLRNARKLNPEFLNDEYGYNINSIVEFDMSWGLGSSSSLIANIAEWANCNPMDLHFATSKGSGYDVACATSDMPIIYRKTVDGYNIKPVKFAPKFSSQLYFVYLGKKQDSQLEVARFNKLNQNIDNAIKETNELTLKFSETDDFDEFSQTMKIHEKIIGKIIGQTPIQQKYFNDFEGTIKSLGAWGGDFCMVATKLAPDDVKAYFAKHNLNTVLAYNNVAYNINNSENI